MGYQFDGSTGELGDFDFDTAEGWVPYWNLKGEYMGMKLPSYKYQDDIYFAYPSDVYVASYWDLSGSAIVKKLEV